MDARKPGPITNHDMSGKSRESARRFRCRGYRSCHAVDRPGERAPIMCVDRTVGMNDELA